ncbi:hypothetical protein LACR_0054 [Lactococcus cremoris subsp. cremoris SK11]|uniref:Uncharacterized protein n=1 Tax=Lactococcus lactis subsp. cremoris (strain SK11) TaxID=272622 RepID=Q033E0_LACLS|nr:hypothetical protein LACR_0054 [Lactococcus cremoris subsp. cremoris SK11]EQC54957.1 hypothetical protein LLT5_14270 [Lactococcus cremoris subsp. cremoris TIFN5]
MKNLIYKFADKFVRGFFESSSAKLIQKLKGNI